MRRSIPLLVALALAAPAGAQTAAPEKKRVSTPVGAFGQNSKQPINIEADELRVLQKEDRAVYSGNVIAVQGDTTMRCTQLHVFFELKKNEKGKGPELRAAIPAAKEGEGGGESAIKRLECQGPVSIVSKDQIATGQRAIYDRVGGLVTLDGDVALSQGGNVTRGPRMIYNINTGIARMEGGRVRGVFEPSDTDGKKKKATN